jgi:catechol 2,3-dioxygenase-like lactoylglutathione lyase family enzyme
MTENTNPEFEIGGLHHVALVCEDMQRTVDFYTNVLGMKLVKTIDLPGGTGQHFFFDMGGGQALAFFWFPEAQGRAPGLSNPRGFISEEVLAEDPTAWLSSHGSMNHLAFMVSPEKLDEYRQKLMDKGLEVTPIMRHDTSESQIAEEENELVFISSIYFLDPDGIMLEFAAWNRELSAELGDRADHKPATPADIEKYRAQAQAAAQAAE